MKCRYGDKTFTGRDARAVCEAMWRDQRFALHATLEDWMATGARVAEAVTGRAVCTDTPEAFLHDLESAGLVEVRP